MTVLKHTWQWRVYDLPAISGVPFWTSDTDRAPTGDVIHQDKSAHNGDGKNEDFDEDKDDDGNSGDGDDYHLFCHLRVISSCSFVATGAEILLFEALNKHSSNPFEKNCKSCLHIVHKIIFSIFPLLYF